MDKTSDISCYFHFWRVTCPQFMWWQLQGSSIPINLNLTVLVFSQCEAFPGDGSYLSEPRMNLPGAAMETECGNAEQSLLQAQQGKYSSPGTHICSSLKIILWALFETEVFPPEGTNKGGWVWDVKSAGLSTLVIQNWTQEHSCHSKETINSRYQLFMVNKKWGIIPLPLWQI